MPRAYVVGLLNTDTGTIESAGIFSEPNPTVMRSGNYGFVTLYESQVDRDYGVASREAQDWVRGNRNQEQPIALLVGDD